jgi:chemotaxis receptor (MCP) glutamine deamidase CheD
MPTISVVGSGLGSCEALVVEDTKSAGVDGMNQFWQ